MTSILHANGSEAKLKSMSFSASTAGMNLTRGLQV